MRALVLFIAGMSIFSCSGSRPNHPDIASGRLPACPDRPNCVSSQAEDPARRIDPIPYAVSREAAKERLAEIIRSMPRSSIVMRGENYLQVEFKTAVMGFVDDALFYFDDVRKKIDVRSASRVGYSDLGANGKRIERIREKFFAP
ncbi:DUF1499 domain-containing protein [Desulfococcus sp.]|uniref:DUF1499 domain-containing protein n=1 Tax=Desulfococcus sp. TaxID=2025834 RepID=UPI003593742F